MPSYIFVSPGSDPGAGRTLVDPMLSSSKPTMGTCRPDLRRMVKPGDHIFVVSGRLGRTYQQYVIGGMQIDEKLADQLEALRRLPQNALRVEGKNKAGNIIALPDGTQHPQDRHTNFDSRIKNYVLGKNPVMLETPREVQLGRERSVDILSSYSTAKVRASSRSWVAAASFPTGRPNAFVGLWKISSARRGRD